MRPLTESSASEKSNRRLVAKLLGRIERWQEEQPLAGSASLGNEEGTESALLTGEPD